MLLQGIMVAISRPPRRCQTMMVKTREMRNPRIPTARHVEMVGPEERNVMFRDQTVENFVCPVAS